VNDRTARQQTARQPGKANGVKDSELGAWLRQQREDRGWTKPEMARRLIQAGREAGDTGMPGIDGVVHNINRWEAEGGVSERYRLPYCRTFGIHPSQFGPRANEEPGQAVRVPAQASADDPDLVDLHLPLSGTVAYRGTQQPDVGRFTVEREVLMAAHESSDHAADHELQGIGEVTFEQLRADVERLSRLTDSDSPLPAFLEARRVRDRIYRLLDRRLWPREQTDLYFLLGCVHALMGLNANQLGYPDAAEELIRAGWVYAHAIDHNPLRGKLRSTLAFINYMRGRFREASDHATDGLRYVSRGPQGADLHLNHARAAARLGELDTARQAVELAHVARDSDYRDDLIEIGGNQFAQHLAMMHTLAGGALVEAGAYERDAIEELEHAISLYDEPPGPGEQHPFDGKANASSHIAVVRLRSGALDGAAAVLAPVMALPPAQRVTSVTARLARVREELAAPVFRGSPLARQLGDQIEEFDREAVTAGLHALTG
jgi:hypothetical protein